MMPASGAAAPAVAASTERSGSSRSDCTDCSHCANRSRVMARSGVRVSVNLRQFFSDQRARAFMWAPHGRCVQWLGRRVARVFGLPDDIALMSRGHMLPVIEPLLMLDRDDPVEVVNMSYVFTPYEKQDDPNVTSQITINKTGAPKGRTDTNPLPVQSSVTNKQENSGQLPTSSQGDNLAENHDISGVHLQKDMVNSLGSLERQCKESVDDNENLEQLKRRALRMLDAHCHILHEASAPKRLRRRRRRRTLYVPSDAPSAPDAAYDAPGASDAAHDAPSASDAAHDETGAYDEESQPNDPADDLRGSGDIVLRNGFGSRPPRLVRALSPSCVLPDML